MSKLASLAGLPIHAPVTPRSPLRDSVVLAVNVGGPPVTDSNGIVYLSDQTSPKGYPKTNPTQYLHTGVPLADAELYKSYRNYPWAASFHLPDLFNGYYVLVLKFCEFEYTAVKTRVYNVKLGEISILQNFDVFAKVGYVHPHDELIPFKISSNGAVLTACGQTQKIDTTLDLTVESVKGHSLLNAFYIARGTPSSLNIELPTLPRFVISAKDPEEKYHLQQEKWPLPPYPTPQDNVESRPCVSPSTCTDAQQMMSFLQKAVDDIALSQDQLALAGPLLSLTGTALLAVGKYLEDKAQNDKKISSEKK